MRGKLVVSAKSVVRLRRMDSVKYVVDEERDRRRILPSKAGCRFS